MGIEQLTRKLFSSYYHSRSLKSPGVFKLYDEYVANSRLSREKIMEIQSRRLKSLLIHARDNTEYYKQLFSDYSFDPEKFESVEQLDVLPILTKKIIRDNTDRLLAKNITESERHMSMTGGTSGVRMSFYRSNSCRAHRLAVQWRSDAWTGWEPNESMVYFWPIIRDIGSITGTKQDLISQYITGFKAYLTNVLNREVCGQIVDSINKFKPGLIRCFPTPTVIIAEYIINNNISLPGIKGIVTSGEPLYSRQRDILERAFNSRVFNLYASREVGTVAAECKAHEDMHISVDSLVVEVTDNGKRLPVGKFGEILITDLLNYAFPLIRYRIHDFGQLSDEICPCGMEYPLMKNVVGRTNDIFYDINGNKIVSVMLELDLVVKGPKVGQVQIIQNSVKDILVRFSNDPMPTDLHREFYTSGLKRIIKGVENVSFEIVDKIEPEESGKYRFTINRMFIGD